MTFLAMSAQKSLLTLQKSQLQFEQMLVTNQVNWCKKQMNSMSREYAEMEDQGQEVDLDKDPFYIELQNMDEQLSVRMQDLNDQITLMDNEINSTKTLVNNSIKSDCGLNLLGG